MRQVLEAVEFPPDHIVDTYNEGEVFWWKNRKFKVRHGVAKLLEYVDATSDRVRDSTTFLAVRS